MKNNQMEIPTERQARECLGTFLACWLVLFEVYMLHCCLGAWSSARMPNPFFLSLSDNTGDLLQRQAQAKIIAALILWTTMYISNYAHPTDK